jgi:hypothetical protein
MEARGLRSVMLLGGKVKQEADSALRVVPTSSVKHLAGGISRTSARERGMMNSTSSGAGANEDERVRPAKRGDQCCNVRTSLQSARIQRAELAKGWHCA